MLVETEKNLQNTKHPVRRDFKVIAVAGVTSGSGKTSLAEAIIKLLSKQNLVGAAKITVTHGEKGCPHGGKGCNTCSSLGGEYQIINKPSVISQRGTDTSRFETAGGKPVVWVITKDTAFVEAWCEAVESFQAESFIVVESNTLALKSKPDMTVMIVDPSVSRKLWKTSACLLIEQADVLVFNKRGNENQVALALEETKKIRGDKNGIIFVNHPHEIVKEKAFIENLESLLFNDDRVVRGVYEILT